MNSLSRERARVSDKNKPREQNRHIEISYVQQSRVETFLRSKPSKVFARINYGRPPQDFGDPTPISISVKMDQLNEPPLTEVWTSSLPVSTHTVNGVRVAFDDEVLFGHIQCEGLHGMALEEVVSSAYTQIFDTILPLGYPSLVRVWNYFPGINTEQKGLERYKQFCIGRHQAFSERYREYKLILPAASAVGTSSGPLEIYFLAGRPQAIHIENPRQISAYDYPPIYGPKSPAFARATVIPMPSLSYLFISGTASIVGHATRHEDDCLKQTKETLTNLESLREHAQKVNREVFRSHPTLRLLKVYVRHHQHREVVKETIHGVFGDQIPTLFLQGEMCRRNLLVEMEAFYTIHYSS